jgi:cytochrome c
MRPHSRIAPRLALLLACAALSAATVAEAQSPEENYGAAVARRDCSQCHAIGLTGDSSNAKAPRFRELHKQFVVPELQDRLLEQLMLHHADMPRFRLSMEELTGLIAYLKLLQADQLTYGPPALSQRPRG